MSDSEDAVEPRPPPSGRRGLLAFVAALAVILLPVIYVVTRGEHGTPLAVTSPSPSQVSGEQPQRPVDEQPNTNLILSVDTKTATGVLARMRAMVYNRRTSILGVSIALSIVALAVAVALYYTNLFGEVDWEDPAPQDNTQEALLEEQRRLEQQIRLEAEAKASREFYYKLLFRAVAVNLLLSAVFIFILQYFHGRASLGGMAFLFIFCGVLQQGIFLLITTASIGIYNLCCKILARNHSSVGGTIAVAVARLAMFSAKMSSRLCVPVAMCAPVFYPQMNVIAIFTRLEECRNSLGRYRRTGIGLVRFKWSLN